jgi:hypothetical protein
VNTVLSLTVRDDPKNLVTYVWSSWISTPTLPGLAEPRRRSAGSHFWAEAVQMNVGYEPDLVYTVHLPVSPTPDLQFVVAAPLLYGE